MLKMIYADFPGVKHQTSLFSSLAFAGTVCGMLIFGLVSDRIGRKVGMVFCSLWLVLFSILIAGSWGAGGSVGGLFAALQAYRFLLGIGIGGEYPSGSVASAEGTESKGVNPKRTQSLFIFATSECAARRCASRHQAHASLCVQTRRSTCERARPAAALRPSD